MKEILFAFWFLVSIFNTFAHHYDVGYKHYRSDEYEKAIACFNLAIAQNDHIAEAHLYRGACYTFLRKFSNAISDIALADSLGADKAQINFIRGKLFLFSTRYDSSIILYSQAIAFDPNFAAAYGDRGIAKAFKGDFYGTIEDDSMAILIDSFNDSYYCDRGYARIKIQEYNSAIRDLKIALTIRNSQRTNTNLGLAYFMNGQYSESLVAYNEAIHIVRDDPETLYLRALSYEKLGKTAEACSDFIQSSRLGYTSSEEKIRQLHCEK